VRRAITAVALLLLSGCELVGVPIEVLTGVSPEACYAGGETGMTGPLVADAEHGTRFNGHPVMWPLGYTGRQIGTEVEILDAEGKVRARTGRTYHISIAPVAEEHWATQDRLGAYPAAVTCGYAHDFVDCTADPANQYCLPE
jgi:hypothetical protein